MDHPRCQFSTLRLELDKQGFITCLSFPPFSLTQVLALIKHRFYAPTCRVNVWNNHHSPCLLTYFNNFSVYLISRT
jgi:hypothetical protein